MLRWCLNSHYSVGYGGTCPIYDPRWAWLQCTYTTIFCHGIQDHTADTSLPNGDVTNVHHAVRVWIVGDNTMYLCLLYMCVCPTYH
jgi:hypothetical protein